MNGTNKEQQKQLAVINQQTISLFKRSLNNKDLTEEIFRTRTEVSYGFFGNTTLINYDLANYEKYADLLIDMSDHYLRVEKVINCLKEYSQQLESDLKQRMIGEYQVIINSQQNGYTRFVTALEKSHQLAIIKKEDELKERDLTIATIQSYLERAEQRISDLKTEIHFYKKQLSEYESKRANWAEIIRSKRRSIQSNEDFLTKSLNDLNSRLHDLSDENLSKEEEIILLKENISNYSLTIKYCEKIITKLKNEIKIQEDLLMVMDNNELAWEAKRILLEGRILELENIISDLRREKADNEELIIQWEKNKADLLERLDGHANKYGQLQAECTQLENKVGTLTREKEALQETIDKLGENIDLWQAKSRKAIINFNFERNNLLEQLKTTNNLSLTSKLKLRGLLALDTMRNFVPERVGNYITYLETTLFASEITGWGSTFAWTSFWIFSWLIWILGIIKLYYWGKWGWLKIFRNSQTESDKKKEPDFQDIKEELKSVAKSLSSDK